jgi:hypothetical protein
VSQREEHEKTVRKLRARCAPCFPSSQDVLICARGRAERTADA